MKKSHYYQVIVRLMTISSIAYCHLAATEPNHLEENYLTKQQLTTQAEEFVLQKLNPNKNKTIVVSTMPIDKRITIPACPTGLTFSASDVALSQSNVTVKAQCRSINWYMFLVVKAQETQSVVVISSAVSPGTLLTENNVHIVNMDKKRLRTSTFADINEVLGARIKRRVLPGRPVDPKNLCYVCKGDRVVISAGTTNMQIKTSGEALEDGNMGETIRVKNTRSNKKIHARVTSTGRVEINI
jgi:flagella basal body P-ring formation protein FlgA